MLRAEAHLGLKPAETLANGSGNPRREKQFARLLPFSWHRYRIDKAGRVRRVLAEGRSTVRSVFRERMKPQPCGALSKAGAFQNGNGVHVIALFELAYHYHRHNLDCR